MGKKLFLTIICVWLLLGLTGCGNSKHIHLWQDATCIEPKHCSECGEISGEPLGHTVNLGICSRCGKIIHGEIPLKIEEINNKIYKINDSVPNYINGANYNNLQDCYNKYLYAYNEIIKAKVELEKIISLSKNFDELTSLKKLAQGVIDNIPSEIKGSSLDDLIKFLKEYQKYLLAFSDYFEEAINVLDLFKER